MQLGDIYAYNCVIYLNNKKKRIVHKRSMVNLNLRQFMQSIYFYTIGYFLSIKK